MPSILAFFSQANMHRRRKQFHFGGAERNTHCDAAICAARININKVSRVKYCGGPAPPHPPAPLVPMPMTWPTQLRPGSWKLLSLNYNILFKC